MGMPWSPPELGVAGKVDDGMMAELELVMDMIGAPTSAAAVDGLRALRRLILKRGVSAQNAVCASPCLALVVDRMKAASFGSDNSQVTEAALRVLCTM